MSCCGYHTLQWYYTYPSNPYQYVKITQPKPMLLETTAQPSKASSTTTETFTSAVGATRAAQRPAGSWYDLNMGWYNPPSA
jgi:hypothetical protein